MINCKVLYLGLLFLIHNNNQNHCIVINPMYGTEGKYASAGLIISMNEYKVSGRRNIILDTQTFKQLESFINEKTPGINQDSQYVSSVYQIYIMDGGPDKILSKYFIAENKVKPYFTKMISLLDDRYLYLKNELNEYMQR